jgi:hypothetical protein
MTAGSSHVGQQVRVMTRLDLAVSLDLLAVGHQLRWSAQPKDLANPANF